MRAGIKFFAMPQTKEAGKYGLKKLFSPKLAGQRAVNAAMAPPLDPKLSGFKLMSRNADAFKQNRRAQGLYKPAYRRQKNINMAVGIGVGAMLYPNTGQTGPNQNTFARRGIQNRRTVGISSGAMQSIQRGSSMYGSIGSM
jgi:hypothetical protein